MLNTETKEYYIVRLDHEKLKDLEALHTAVYGQAPPENYFQKKYDTTYTGVEYLGYIAYNLQNIAVAYYGVMPCFIQYDDEIILSAQSGDTMTHPGYRYKGMFVELSRITFELCRQSGIKFIFGFPNQNSYHGAINKLGWKMTEAMECFIIPVTTLPLASLSKKIKWLGKPYERYKKRILDKYTLHVREISNSVIRDGYAGIYRDKKYFEYKTYSDTHVIGIGKAKAWVKIKNNMVIGDLDLAGEAFDTVMKKINKIAALMGIREILFHTCQRTSLYGLFIARYKSSPSFPVLFQDLNGDIVFEKIKFSFGDIDIF